MSADDLKAYRYAGWCIKHRIPNVVAATPLLIGALSPALFMVWLGWWGVPLAVIGFTANAMVMEMARDYAEHMTAEIK